MPPLNSGDFNIRCLNHSHQNRSECSHDDHNQQSHHHPHRHNHHHSHQHHYNDQSSAIIDHYNTIMKNSNRIRIATRSIKSKPIRLISTRPKRSRTIGEDHQEHRHRPQCSIGSSDKTTNLKNKSIGKSLNSRKIYQNVINHHRIFELIFILTFLICFSSIFSTKAEVSLFFIMIDFLLFGFDSLNLSIH